MYRILFAVFPIIFFSCRQYDHEQKPAAVPDSVILQKNTAQRPAYSENDSVHPPFEAKETSALTKFLQKNLDQKDLIFFNQDTLSCSALIDSGKKIRIDRFSGKGTIIISRYYFGEKPAQVISINGSIARSYREKNANSREDIWDINKQSFRHFIFKGEPYYYMTARIMDCEYGSACLLEYHLLYNVHKKELSEFNSFRVDEHYFFGDVDGDDRLDFLEINNEGGYGIDSINRFGMSIYSCDRSGFFRQLKDGQGKPYFISGNTNGDQYVGDDMNIEKYYWPVPLK